MKQRDFATMTVAAISHFLSNTQPTNDDLQRLSRDRRAGVKRTVERYLSRREMERKEKDRLEAMLGYERSLRNLGYTYIAGVDEAGRGPLAGPVLAGAVILTDDFYLPGLNDSKQVLPPRRVELYREITSRAVAWSIGIGEVAEIDSYNIYVASKMAMFRAISSLAVRPDYVLLDALELEGLECPQRGIVGGDRLSQSVAAASIIAKVTRDRWMCEIDKVYPGYGFAEHKGYATTQHRNALSVLGSCPVHRMSFTLLPGER